ncbi:hypothetical protein C1H46_037585 [Malus baccata]|uniref:RDR1/2-like RRM domain-containing protein n=1 Tax=Malus baccata TaxID=106549 RepID=A0A540KRV5_MALBA|nr:hypothetical protein C1H46_037585 [Malus baccata]
MGVAERPTVRVTNIPQTVTAQELLTFLESKLGRDSVFAVEISSDHKNWKSRGFGRIQFTTLKAKLEAHPKASAFPRPTTTSSSGRWTRSAG